MLTNQKKIYAESREAGKNQTDSARAAGYSEKTIYQKATQLEKDQSIIDYRIKLQALKAEQKPVKKTVLKQKPEREKPQNNETGKSEIRAQNAAAKIASESMRQEKRFSCPLEFLEHVMNDELEESRLRIDAAKSLAPYKHQKKGETGKKQSKAEAAAVLGGRFAPRVVK